MGGGFFFKFGLPNARPIPVISNANDHGVVERPDNFQECAHHSPKSSGSPQETLDHVQCKLCVGWKEPGRGASWFKFDVGLTGCVA